MANFATRVSNVIYWICIAATAVVVGMGAYGLVEHFIIKHGDIDQSAFVFVFLFGGFFTAIWAIIQYLITGIVKIQNIRIVSLAMIVSTVIGAISGYNNGNRILASNEAFQERIAIERARVEAEKNAAVEAEGQRLLEAIDKCSERKRVYDVAVKDDDYQMAKDLYDRYSICIHQYGFEIPKFGNDVFTGKEKIGYKRIR
jgi:hypothetical protein